MALWTMLPRVKDLAACQIMSGFPRPLGLGIMGEQVKLHLIVWGDPPEPDAEQKDG